MNPHAFPAHPDGNSGMSLRDYFAAAALQGLLADNPNNEWGSFDYANNAYELADAMLEQRK